MIFGITMGDASGVGPEILLKAFRRGELRNPVVVFGDMTILERCNQMLSYGVPLRAASDPTDYREGCLNVLDLKRLEADELRIGEVSAKSGAAARDYVVAATKAALNGRTAAIVTLPMNKRATQLSDPEFAGHTELIGSLCGVTDATMMLVSESIIVTHVSTHLSMLDAIERVTKERVFRVIELTHDAVRKLRGEPRIAVAGLNPHAGENGLFGREEIDEIHPAVDRARELGMHIDGPLPPDTLFYLAVQKKRFDAIVCMYHDQGHIPLKLLDFEGGVNVTLGLPIIRTSVDHGTAFDIAYRGVASTRSLISALELAVRMATG